MAKSVPDRLADLGRIYQSRNTLYKDNYKHFGKVLIGMFPNGLDLNTEEEFNRFALFVQATAKLTRYANMFKDRGHADSNDDCAVYTQMLNEYDEEIGEPPF